MALSVVQRATYVGWNSGVFGVRFDSQYSTAAHSLRVNQQVKEKRRKALLGGGPYRIDAQHNKVQNKIRSMVTF
jgi:hypothetical protein